MKRVLFSVFTLLMCMTANAGITFSADKVKAVYLVRFANFIHWPQEESFSQINYCVMGESKVTYTLKTLLVEHQVRNISVVYRQIENVQSLSQCQLVYFTPEAYSHLNNDRGSTISLDRVGLVTVSDQYAFAKTEGMVEFREKSGRIVPVINIDNAAKNRITIRSQLLRISKLISEPQGDE
ncbi:YfiR family protein [Photobacterium sanguinicancri]|uniref:DUF4154 domain-containing protein n=1 Tax=Photobacterium sanguinicancri TaxID=875932 RepID=A0ABX4FT11_9GAMM|nr:YfiR family protein [Photobacterium sanguinicancri]OZS41775.1 hypothetical protein ASV53_21935 [Photobacterium sanguinicancri]